MSQSFKSIELEYDLKGKIRGLPDQFSCCDVGSKKFKNRISE